MAFNTDPRLWLSIGQGLTSGSTVGGQIGGLAQSLTGYQDQQAQQMAASQQQQAALQAKQLAAQQKNQTLMMLEKTNPELAQAVKAGALSPNDAFVMDYKQRFEAKKPKPMPQSFQEYQLAQENPGYAEYISGNGKNPADKLKAETEARRQAALAQGMNENDPAFDAYVLTGKMPREDQAPKTATDKKAIMEADDLVMTNETAIQMLNKAKEISPKANTGALAGPRAWLGNNAWDYIVPDQVSSPDSSLATTDLDNIVLGNALEQLKSTFGAAPTEGERTILIQLQGSSNLPDEARQRIYDRAIELAQRRLEFNRRKAEELRNETYYDPRSATTTTATSGKTKTGVTFSVEGQ